MTLYKGVLKNIYHEWHYLIMIKYGFIPIIEKYSDVIKKYVYRHSRNEKHLITISSYKFDVWYDKRFEKTGYANDLINHLIKINSKIQ